MNLTDFLGRAGMLDNQLLPNSSLSEKANKKLQACKTKKDRKSYLDDLRISPIDQALLTTGLFDLNAYTL